MMKVHKMGGKFLCDASGFRKAGQLISGFERCKYLIVVSAVAYTTRLLDQIFESAKSGNTSLTEELLGRFLKVHLEIIIGIFQAKNGDMIKNIFMLLFRNLKDSLGTGNFSEVERAKILSFGEISSSLIMSQYLKKEILGPRVVHVSALKMIRTSGSLTEATVSSSVSHKMTSFYLSSSFKDFDFVVTEGFVGRDGRTKKVSLLGYDGSDTSAAWFGNFLNADAVTFWKDVSGVLLEDPNKNPNAKVFTEMTYQELKDHIAHGCTVIHPNAVTPLMEAGIPITIRSFNDLSNPGTIIR